MRARGVGVKRYRSTLSLTSELDGGGSQWRLKTYCISVIHFYVSLTHISLVNITEICDWGIDGHNQRLHERCRLVSTGYANSHIWYLVHRKLVCHRDNHLRSGGNLMCLVWSSNSQAEFPKTLGESCFRNETPTNTWECGVNFMSRWHGTSFCFVFPARPCYASSWRALAVLHTYFGKNLMISKFLWPARSSDCAFCLWGALK